jgi:TorA maturation chaperone TorD
MELLRTLGTVMSPPDAIVARLAAVLELPASPTSSEHTFLFGSQLPPFASVYLSTSGERGGDACDRIAGYWRAVGLTPPAEPDRLAHMLGFYADLLDQEEHEADQARRHAVTRIRKAFLAEQLLTWLPAFLTKVDLIAPRPYRRWGQLVEQVIGREAWRSAPLATVPPLQERDRARVDPRPGDVESLVTYLAAPVRCGLILAPVDLERVAAELQVATPADHVGQALRALFAARPNDLLAWLTSEARRWEARHERNRDLLPALSDHWTRRARTTRVLLINWSRGADAATAVGEPAEPAHAGAGPAGTPRDSSNRPRTPR